MLKNNIYQNGKLKTISDSIYEDRKNTTKTWKSERIGKKKPLKGRLKTLLFTLNIKNLINLFKDRN